MVWSSRGKPDLPVYIKQSSKTFITLCGVWSTLQLACMVAPNLMVSLVPRLKWVQKMWSGNETTSFPALSPGQHTLGPTIAALNEYTADCSGWRKCDDQLLWEKAGGHPTSVRVAVKEETHHWHCLGWSKLLAKILYNLKLGNFQTVKDFADTWACTLAQAAVGTVFSQPFTCIQGHAVTIFVDYRTRYSQHRVVVYSVQWENTLCAWRFPTARHHIIICLCV